MTGAIATDIRATRARSGALARYGLTSLIGEVLQG